MRRGRWPAALSLALLVATTIVACAVNPATGRRQLMFMSPEEEAAIGREADPDIVAQMGLVPDSALTRYVRGIGLELAAASELPDLPWTVRVLDDPVINAFALPGGFVYVTRGLLANMTSEAQLAGVLGHEVGHVTARHGAGRMTTQSILGIGLVLGAVLSETVAENFDAFSAGAGILALGYGRDDELQADRLGLRYMDRLGYEPRELAGVMEMLGRSSQLQPGGRATPEWLSTHPDPENRVAEIYEEIDVMGIAPGGTVRDEEFVRRLDGLVFGANPREGFAADGVFHHPDLEFRFDVPEAWQVQNSREAVVVASEKGQMVFSLATGKASDALAEFTAQDGIEVTGRSGSGINGFPAATATFAADSDGTRLWGRVTFVEHGGNTYRMLGLTAWTDRQSIGTTISRSIESFRTETDPAVLGRRPNRIEVVQLGEALPFATFLDRYPSVVEPAVVALMNQVDPEGTIGPGAVKRVVN